MATFPLRTFHGGKILQFDTESSFLPRFLINFYYQYAKIRNAAYGKVHLDLLQSFLKIKLKTYSQPCKNIVDRVHSSSFCAVQ